MHNLLNLENKYIRWVKTNKMSHVPEISIKREGDYVIFNNIVDIPCKYILLGLERIGVLKKDPPSNIVVSSVYYRNYKEQPIMDLAQSIYSNKELFLYFYDMPDNLCYIEIKDLLETLIEFNVLKLKTVNPAASKNKYQYLRSNVNELVVLYI